MHQNQPYDESLEVPDSEDIASVYTPTPRVSHHQRRGTRILLAEDCPRRDLLQVIPARIQHYYIMFYSVKCLLARYSKIHFCNTKPGHVHLIPHPTSCMNTKLHTCFSLCACILQRTHSLVLVIKIKLSEVHTTNASKEYKRNCHVLFRGH